MRVAEPGDLEGDVDRLAQAREAAPEPLAQGLALVVGHGDEDLAVRGCRPRRWCRRSGGRAGRRWASRRKRSLADRVELAEGGRNLRATDGAGGGPRRGRRRPCRRCRACRGCCSAKRSGRSRRSFSHERLARNERPSLARGPSEKIASRQRPTLPHTCACSTIGAEGLNCRVRNGNGCFPLARATGKLET